jgi:hypothetical protein
LSDVSDDLVTVNGDVRTESLRPREQQAEVAVRQIRRIAVEFVDRPPKISAGVEIVIPPGTDLQGPSNA